jgi:hypothetical protein
MVCSCASITSLLRPSPWLVSPKVFPPEKNVGMWGWDDNDDLLAMLDKDDNVDDAGGRNGWGDDEGMGDLDLSVGDDDDDDDDGNDDNVNGRLLDIDKWLGSFSFTVKLVSEIMRAF